MASKKTKKDGTPQVHLPNKWVRVVGSRVACTECGAQQGKGMMWVDGAVRACRPCGSRLARRPAA